MTGSPQPDIVKNLAVFITALALAASVVAVALYFFAVMPVQNVVNTPPANDKVVGCAGETPTRCIDTMYLYCDMNAGGPDTWAGFWCRVSGFLGCEVTTFGHCNSVMLRQ